MFNRSEILRKAWASYRVARMGRWVVGDESGKRSFLRPLFARCLRRAWDDAKVEARSANSLDAARLAAQLQASIRASQADLAARMDPMARAARIASLRDELTLLDYAPWGVRTADRRSCISAELRLLETAAATQSLAA